MSLTVNGITFDGLHTYDDFGFWLAERPDLGSPIPKTNIVSVPGADGELDLTEANSGEVRFENRIMRFVLSRMADVADHADIKAEVMNALHGRIISQIVLDEDPDWFYTGRASVVFETTESWKLRCVVEVNAHPYAMKLIDTTVWLTDTGATPEPTQVLRGTDSNGEWPDSSIMLGTSEFPTGVDFYGADRLVVTWDNRQVHSGTNIITVYDSLGSTETFNITQSSSGRYEILYTALSAAQIDLAKVYRIAVSGITGCALYTENDVYHFRAYNTRKSAVPVFYLPSAGVNSVVMTINGSDYTFTPPGEATIDGLYLKSGWNEIYIDPDQFTSYPSYFYMKYREGKL